MSWKRFYRRECPVCGGTRKDCRQSTTTGLIHCRELEANPPNFIFRGYDALGFGMWADKVDAEAWTEEKRQELQEIRRRERRAEQARRMRLLSESERDRTMRSILSQLSLSEKHRNHLRERGLSDEQIEAGLYRSVNQWQKLLWPVDDRLAGVSLGGNGLCIPAAGILCPIANHKGELLGWQVRFDDPGDLPKYLWASPEKSRRKNGPSVHLKNGELPLAFFNPVGKPHKVISRWFKGQNIIPVALTEGVAFKPAITAQRLGIFTLGASGGHFASSPECLKAYLDHVKDVGRQGEGEQGGGGDIALQPILFADGGCLVNENILQVYGNTAKALKELGYEMKVAWWDQIEKSDGDIDEIDPEKLSQIRLLTTEEFYGLVKKVKRDRRIKVVQKELQSLSYEPQIQLNQRYLPNLAEIIPFDGIVALKSPKGSGKSVQIKNILNTARSQGMKVVSITPRRALGREQSIKWEMEWGGDTEVGGLHRFTLLENWGSVGICWDSLWKLMERDWSHTVVVIDEAELALIHLLLSSTCKDKRPLILRTLETKLRQCLAHGGMLLLADADLTDLSINYFKSLVPDVPVFLVLNEYISPDTSWPIEFYRGKNDEAIAQLTLDLATPVKIGTENRQRRLAIATDSQDQAEALERFIKERLPEVSLVRVDSTTTETEEGRQFVEQPNESILGTRPEVLLYTPSMGVGVSIDVEWFDQMYGFFNGVIEPSQCRQMLGRIRANIPRVIWSRERGMVDSSVSFLPEEIKSHLFAFHKQTNILLDVVKAIAPDNPNDLQLRRAYDALWNQDKQEWDNAHLNLYCDLMARKNYGIHNLAEELHRQLTEEGHKILNSFGDGYTEEGLRVAEIKKQLPLEEAEAIANAQDIPLDVALMLLQKSGTTEKQRHQISKALLKAELPLVPLTADFIYKAVTKDKRRWLNAVKLFWYSQNGFQVRAMDRREWLNHLSKFTKGVIYLRTYSLQVKVLDDLGLFDYLDLDNPEKEYTSDSLETLQLMKRAKRYGRNLYLAFRLRASDTTQPINFLNRLLERMELRLIFDHHDKSGKRFYRLDNDKLHDPERVAVLRSLSQKWSDIDTEPEEIESTLSRPYNTPVNYAVAEIAQEERSFSRGQKTKTAIATQEQKQLITQADSTKISSRHPSISINNNSECCDPHIPEEVSPNPDQEYFSLATPEPVNIVTKSALKEGAGDEGAKQPQPQPTGTESSSQHSPISINNNSECCDPSPPTTPPDNSLGQIPAPTDPLTSHEVEEVYYPHLDKLSPQERGKLEELAGQLEQASEGQAQNLETLLGKATDYLKLNPTHRVAFWEALSFEVKDTMFRVLPHYYHALIPELKISPPTALPYPHPLSRQKQEEVEELAGWLADAAQGSSKDFEDLLGVAVEYLRLEPNHRVWLWRSLTPVVQEAAARQFPTYYQQLRPPEAETTVILPPSPEPPSPEPEDDCKALAARLSEALLHKKGEPEALLRAVVAELDGEPDLRLKLWEALTIHAKSAMLEKFPNYYRALSTYQEPVLQSFAPPSPEEQDDAEAIAQWTAQAALRDTTDFEEMLGMALEYLESGHNHRVCLWLALKDWVKEAILRQFPDYYQQLNPSAFF